MKLAKATILITILSVAPAAAQSTDAYQTNRVLPGCRELIRNGPREFETQEGFCLGVVSTLLTLGKPGFTRNFPASYRYCIPNGVVTGQALNVALAYIEARPARWHETLMLLTMEAFTQAWPCRE